eukprot:2964993-Rhodomonas_salina.1
MVHGPVPYLTHYCPTPFPISPSSSLACGTIPDLSTACHTVSHYPTPYSISPSSNVDQGTILNTAYHTISYRTTCTTPHRSLYSLVTT